MDIMIQTALAGIAIGSFAALMVETNIIALRTLAKINYHAAEIACVMGKAALLKIGKREEERVQQLQNDDDY